MIKSLIFTIRLVIDAENATSNFASILFFFFYSLGEWSGETFPNIMSPLLNSFETFHEHEAC